MNMETLLTDSTLRNWRFNVDRTEFFSSGLFHEQLLQEIALGKNRLIYLWDHLSSLNDTMFPLLGVGERLHPELDSMFVSSPDRSTQKIISGEEMKRLWDEINEALWSAFSKLSAREWLQRHTSMSEEDFKLEPHSNRFTILLGRIGHLAYHFGQVKIAVLL